MNQGLKLLAIFVRDLLSYDEQLIRIGRKNYEREDFTQPYIVVDGIGPQTRVSRVNHYDGDSETQTLGVRLMAPCTLNFYGPDAYDTAVQFTLMLASQDALELQKAQGLTVYRVSSLTDVKSLTGQQYGENIELQLNVEYNQSIDLDVKRIDTAQIGILTEQGQELTP
jgi:hypothetical protein